MGHQWLSDNDQYPKDHSLTEVTAVEAEASSMNLISLNLRRYVMADDLRPEKSMDHGGRIANKVRVGDVKEGGVNLLPNQKALFRKSFFKEARDSI